MHDGLPFLSPDVAAAPSARLGRPVAREPEDVMTRSGIRSLTRTALTGELGRAFNGGNRGHGSAAATAALTLVAAVAAVLAPSAVAAGATPPYDIGTNLGPNTDYQTQMPWAEVHGMFRQWGQVGAPWNTNPNLQYTADKYPLSDADALSYLNGYPSGTYKLLWDGTGSVTLNGSTVSPTGTQNGSKTADVNINPGSGLIILGIRGTSASDPVRNIRLYTPGTPTDGSVVWNAAFLRRLAPFRTLRFMDWMRTNGSPVRNWSDRATAGSFVKTGDNGVAWEDVISLCNATKRNAWINIPDRATDDYVRNLADLLRDRLDPSLTIYVEYSNEIWNAGFQQYGRIAQDASANSQLTASDQFGRVAQQMAFRAKAISDIFRTEFGSSAGRVRVVLAGQTVNTYFLGTALSYLKNKYGSVSAVSGIAIAPYFGYDLGSADVNGASIDSLFNALGNQLNNDTIPGINAHKNLAAQYGLPLMAYEGGQHLFGTTNQSTKNAMQADPRMGTLTKQLLDTWFNAGGTNFCYYLFMDAYSQYGYWGLLQRASDVGSVKWDLAMRLTLKGGDATLDGTVGYADFLVLKANYGQSGKWWEQGDFNGDRKVDAADYAILRANLTGLTAQQQADVAAFESANGLSTGPTPLSVTITSPASGAGFLAGSTVNIAASAAGGSNAYSKVEFYAGSTLIGTDTAAPFTLAWANVAAGSYSLTAKVTDSNGQTATSPAVSVTVAANNPPPTPNPGNGTGTGLSGQYFRDTTLTTAAFTRTDATVNFDWGTNGPGNNLSAYSFSVRWTGQVQPRYSETYTFTTTSDDGVRLWVNGQQIVNNWTDHASTDNTGTITLTAGQKYDIKMEYYQAFGGAIAKLAWQSPSQAKEIVPATQLYPAANTGGPGGPGTPSTGPVTLEAETAALSGGAYSWALSGASGGRVVGYVGGPTNGTVTFTANVATAGSYTLTFCYVMGSTRTATLSRNGGTPSVISFPPTGGAVGSLSQTITLNAGANTLAITGQNGGWAPDFDCIKLAPVAAPTSSSYEAEASGNTLSGCYVSGMAGTSGGSVVMGIGNGNTLQVNNVNVPASGTYTLTVYYLCGQARTGTLSVNGGTAQTVSYDASPAWNVAGSKTITVNLNAGNNTLRFGGTSGGGWAPDMDRVTVQGQ
jgi:hypothetical protein